MARYGMVIDLARCTGCQTCVVTCQMHHNTRPGVAWGKIDEIEIGTYPDAQPLCAAACLHALR